MHYKNLRILLCLFIICIPLLLCTQVLASSDAVQSSYSSSDKESFWNALALEHVDEEPSIEPISCFDVSTDGKIALGFQRSNNKTISVYSAENEFLFGYTFQCYGSFYVFWQQENICIYLVRSRVVAIVDMSGNCIAICDASDMGANSEQLKNIKSPTKEVSGKQYVLENDVILGGKYGRLCVTNSDGTQRVLYDAAKQNNFRVVLGSFFTVSFICIATYFFVRRYRGRFVNDTGRG